MGAEVHSHDAVAPPERPGRRRLAAAAVAVVVVGLVLAVLYQPWLTDWGSTPDERTAPLAGDDLVLAPRTTWTRAITIDAPPTRVWPWLVQMGVDKAGFYTYDWGEQLAGDPMHNATAIHPEWQHLAVGDVVRPAPMGAPWVVRQLEPERLLVLALDDRTWSLAVALHPLPGDRTRLVTRFSSHKGSVLSYVLDPADLIVFPRLLVGVRQRAEGTLPGTGTVPTGDPLPRARLPVDGWPALAWLAGLGAVAGLGGEWLGVERWGRRRPHPGLTITLAFVAGAAYALMSDTPPVQFLIHRWLLGTVLAAAIGTGAGRRVHAELGGYRSTQPAGCRSRWASRLVTALAETGLLVVLPVTVVWQAATAAGWTTRWTSTVPAALGAAAAGTAVAAVGRRAWRPSRRADLLLVAALAAAFAFTGSGLAALGGAAVTELVAGRGPGQREPGQREPAQREPGQREPGQGERQHSVARPR